MILTQTEFLLPSQGADMSRWAVIACDQFTSDRGYWERLAGYVGESPSTLRLILPEVYLPDGDEKQRARDIYAHMERYCSDGTLVGKNGFIIVERTLKNGKKRLGAVAAVDLEEYEYTPKNNARIKATEKTVEERLPARVALRKGALLEASHIMLLAENVLGLLREYADGEGETVYDFDLNMNGGHLKGKLIDDPAKLAAIQNAALGGHDGLAFAVGGGHHSLAAATKVWEEGKQDLSAGERKKSPARSAPCEMMRRGDGSLVFEPIHRVVYGADASLTEFLADKLSGEARAEAYYGGERTELHVASNSADAIADIQSALDEDAKAHEGAVTDYVHGDESALRAARENGAVAVMMPCICKDTLFDYTVRRGVLPRKSFSMGDAEDKRYYCEARKIR